MSRYLRDARTHIRTHIQGSTYRSACGETKNITLNSTRKEEIDEKQQKTTKIQVRESSELSGEDRNIY